MKKSYKEKKITISNLAYLLPLGFAICLSCVGFALCRSCVGFAIMSGRKMFFGLFDEKTIICYAAK